jgi:hypothetical protein
MLPVRISWESHEARRNPARRRNAPHTALRSSNERRGPATGPSDFKRRGLTIKRHGRWVSDSAVRVAPQSRSPAQLPASGTSRCADGCCIRTVCSSPPPTVVNLPRTHLRLVARSARSIVRASDWGSHEPLMAAPHPPSHIRDGLPTRPPTRQSILWRRTRKRHSLQRFCQKTPFRVQTVVTCPKRCGTLGAGAPPHGTDARGRAHHGDAPRKRLLVAKRALPYVPTFGMSLLQSATTRRGSRCGAKYPCCILEPSERHASGGHVDQPSLGSTAPSIARALGRCRPVHSPTRVVSCRPSRRPSLLRASSIPTRTP